MANTKTTFIVKSKEEEIGEEYFKVTVPDGTPEEEVMAKFRMAEQYATNLWDEFNLEEYDEHFEEMAEIKEETNGQEAFNCYLEEFCGYKVEPVTYDFVYEW